MGPSAALLACGKRLHLQHGPIDLIIGADGDRNAAFSAAEDRFQTVLAELMAERPLLQRPVTPGQAAPNGETASLMHAAVRPFAEVFVTPMAAVAGAVAETVLKAMVEATPLRRAYVNNGGDIALHLEGDARFTISMVGLDGANQGKVGITGHDGIGGIATSGHGGRSLSMGLADSVTALARTAAKADAAATLIANHVDCPGHPAIRRAKANTVRDDSDLGDRLVTVHRGRLPLPDVITALANGNRFADRLRASGHIHAAALFLQDRSALSGDLHLLSKQENGTPVHV